MVAYNLHKLYMSCRLRHENLTELIVSCPDTQEGVTDNLILHMYQPHLVNAIVANINA